MLAQIPIIIIFSLFIATLLNQKMKLKGFFRAVFFIPAVLITGVVATSGDGNVLLDSLQSGSGIVMEAGAQSVASGTFLQDLLTSIAMSESMSEYIISAVDNIFSIVNMCGVQILIFLSALQSVSPSIYESAKMEGANGWDCYWKITFPMISPMVYVCIIFTIIDSFVNSGNVIMTLVYDLGIKQNKAGIASSMSWLYSLVVLVFLGLATLIMRRFVFYQEKE